MKLSTVQQSIKGRKGQYIKIQWRSYPKLKAAFKCELFVKQFAPPAKKAKKSTKKVENKVDVKATEKKSKKTVKKSEVKETSSKKEAAKKPDSTKK
mgnify:CR=1 FL=1